MIRQPTSSTLFPYTTLFRSLGLVADVVVVGCAAGGEEAIAMTDELAPDVVVMDLAMQLVGHREDRKSTRLNSSHVKISYAVFCLKKKKKNNIHRIYHTVQRG